MHAALVGIAQGVAAFPGISRSGTTIAVAMALGLKPDAAFRFSFLLSLPAILGATLLKGREGLDQADPHGDLDRRAGGNSSWGMSASGCYVASSARVACGASRSTSCPSA